MRARECVCSISFIVTGMEVGLEDGLAMEQDTGDALRMVGWIFVNF